MMRFDEIENLPNVLNVLLSGVKRELARVEREVKAAEFAFHYENTGHQFYDDLASSVSEQSLAEAARTEAQICYEHRNEAQARMDQTRSQTASRKKFLRFASRSLEAEMKRRGITVEIEPQFDEDTIKKIALQVALKSEPGDEARFAAMTMAIVYADVIAYMRDLAEGSGSKPTDSST